ncbi:S-layer homology domain-containing protein [Aetokthonos hydrillicola Thurmond2011]|uniref:S-layer homology domain-containing protein n=1 Tax=Aetokthonos hydrillicola Thurmond2011 TaxID=2712845 RepID=A0AAP5IFK1_9CYAN|nr:fasciclin domain-containing protein [Aetokthonos hydrillicola]MDR9900344.1 S-layer homology domain-containing protein [Aetokthonos hydrillicola Thurmond2011]
MCSLFRRSSASAILLAVGVTGSTLASTIISAPASAQINSSPTPTTPSDQATPPANQAPTTPSDQGTPPANLTPTTPSDQGTPPANLTPTTPSDQGTPPANQVPTAPQTSGTNFSDVGQDYWASPFIQALAARNVIAGFPDGTFKPDQPVTRAEFAALIQKAFNQNPVRQLSAGGFSDVSSNYWAAAAIQRAYEMGFMAGYPGNVFRPNQQIPKVQAIVALTSGLGITSSNASPDILTTYYTDASSIPSYALNNVVAATQTNLVVNYPDVKTLNPIGALTRADAAAIFYQALVKQGQMQPIASNVAASQYVVAGTSTGTPTTAQANTIVNIAASSNSFTTLTSLLQAAGLTDTLQQPGPYTVFAPTDQAFAALPKSTLEKLQRPENRDALVKILTYHVVSGALPAEQLTTGEQKTLEGSPVKIKTSRDNQVRVNKAKILQSNVQASNGVIYPIDKVLLPPDVKLSQLQGGGSNGGASDIDVGRATRGGSSYIGVGGNIGLTGNSDLGDGNFAVISKLGLTRNFSFRPGAVIGSNPVVLLPITYDLNRRSQGSFGLGAFSISPYIGAGIAIDTGNGADVAALVTGGIDIPLGSRFTVNGSVNAAFFDDTAVGITVGIGYNFR